MKTKYSLCMGIVVWMSGILSAGAQGVFSLSELNRSARSMGMGGISSVMESSGFSVFDNASKAALSDKKLEAAFLYTPWAKNLTKGQDRDNLLINAGGYYAFNENQKILVGTSFYRPGGNDLFILDEEGNQVGDRINPRYFSVNVGYARRLNKWGLAAVVSYAQWNPGIAEKTSALSVDVSATRRYCIDSSSFVDISMNASGWGGIMGGQSVSSTYKLPGFIHVGGWYGKSLGENHSLHAGVDLGGRCLDKPAFTGGIGVEYGLKNLVYLRGGYHAYSESNDENGFGTVGAGLSIVKRIQLDVSYLIAGNGSPLKNTFAIGLNIHF